LELHFVASLHLLLATAAHELVEVVLSEIEVSLSGPMVLLSSAQDLVGASDVLGRMAEVFLFAREVASESLDLAVHLFERRHQGCSSS
jgi:hypothetical protein